MGLDGTRGERMRKQNSVAQMMNEKGERDNEARSVGRCGERRDERMEC